MDDQTQPAGGLSFFGRIGLAFKLLFDGSYAQSLIDALAAKNAAPKVLPPERVHASSLTLLAALQREGRLVDFLQQDVAGFSDEEVGAAARVVHGGCRKVLHQFFDFEPATTHIEGAAMTVPQGFDAARIRLTGNVTGKAPYKGTVKHHGWVARQIRMPDLNDQLDARVVAPAEIELA